MLMISVNVVQCARSRDSSVMVYYMLLCLSVIQQYNNRAVTGVNEDIYTGAIKLDFFA